MLHFLNLTLLGHFRKSSQEVPGYPKKRNMLENRPVGYPIISNLQYPIDITVANRVRIVYYRQIGHKY